MRKRDTCVICGEKANCFFYHNDTYVPFCLTHFGMYTNTTLVQNKLIEKKDFEKYLWKR